jgi:hypothetical protein
MKERQRAVAEELHRGLAGTNSGLSEKQQQQMAEVLDRVKDPSGDG